MVNQTLVHALKLLLADTYALYLKTQSYHWHVTGPYFSMLHSLFELQYKEYIEAIDAIAERIRTLGEISPATFSELNQLKSIPDGHPKASAETMIKELKEDQHHVIAVLNKVLTAAQTEKDEVTTALCIDRMAVHEKNTWILVSHLNYSH